MIGFRVDANEIIAMGHLMRCISIAEACKRKGEKCIFFLAEYKEVERLEQSGFQVCVLNTNWQDMEGELSIFDDILRKIDLKYLVVDSYQATAEYLEHLQKEVPVLYIDDLKQQKYDVSAVLHYIGCKQDLRYEKMYENSHTQFLNSMKYAPLREEFQICEAGVSREKSILITTGGSDFYNMAGSVAQLCQTDSELRLYEVHIIVGNMNQHEEELYELKEKYPNIILHKNVTNISYYIRRCEVAVSAGGTTLLELCACKIPTVCFSFVDNQVEFASALGETGAVVYVGDVRENERIVYDIKKQILNFIQDADKRKRYMMKMEQLVDGNGASRIADILLG